MNDGSINKFDLWEAAQHSFSYKKMCVGWQEKAREKRQLNYLFAYLCVLSYFTFKFLSAI